MPMESLNGDIDDQCKKHNKQFIKICKSPYCNYFKLICEDCIATDNHQKWHISIPSAFEETNLMINKILIGLKAVKTRKRKEMELNISNNPGLTQIESKLQEIRALINSKIDKYKNNIKKIYEEHVKGKLDQLEEIIEKSQEFIQKERKKLKSTSNLRPFYLNDFNHQLQYYKSYLNEIFVKKIRNFKTGLDNDNVFALLTSFQQNLQKIFTITKQNTPKKRSHLFRYEEDIYKLYQISDDPTSHLKETNIENQKIYIHNQHYRWSGFPQSVFYPINQCFYIIGEGKRASKKIVKFQENKVSGQQFHRYNMKLVKQLDTERSQFAICLLNNEIYIIGGENEREGCLVKCEKFVPLYNNQVYIISSLNRRSSRHSVTTYKDRYILKFGGTDLLMERGLSSEQIAERKHMFTEMYPEIYSIQTEEWSVIEFKNIQSIKLRFGIFPSIFSNEEKNQIVILGGDNYYSESIGQPKNKFKTGYILKIEEHKKKIEEVRIRDLELDYTNRSTIFSTSITNKQENTFVFMKRKNNIRGGFIEAGSVTFSVQRK